MGMHQLKTLASRRGSMGPMQHTEVRVTIDYVVDLMATKTGSPLTRRAANTLLRQMSETDWVLVEGIHTSGSDPSPHILIEVGGDRFHLRLTKKGVLFEITAAGGDARLRRHLTGGRAPFQPPGQGV